MNHPPVENDDTDLILFVVIDPSWHEEGEGERICSAVRPLPFSPLASWRLIGTKQDEHPVSARGTAAFGSMTSNDVVSTGEWDTIAAADAAPAASAAAICLDGRCLVAPRLDGSPSTTSSWWTRSITTILQRIAPEYMGGEG